MAYNDEAVKEFRGGESGEPETTQALEKPLWLEKRGTLWQRKSSVKSVVGVTLPLVLVKEAPSKATKCTAIKTWNTKNMYTLNLTPNSKSNILYFFVVVFVFVFKIQHTVGCSNSIVVTIENFGTAFCFLLTILFPFSHMNKNKAVCAYIGHRRRTRSQSFFILTQPGLM